MPGWRQEQSTATNGSARPTRQPGEQVKGVTGSRRRALNDRPNKQSKRRRRKPTRQETDEAGASRRDKTSAPPGRLGRPTRRGSGGAVTTSSNWVSREQASRGGAAPGDIAGRSAGNTLTHALCLGGAGGQAGSEGCRGTDTRRPPQEAGIE